jgi:hypothetical protein
MKIISNLTTVLLINMCFLFAACSNNQQAREDESRPDTNVNGAPEISDQDYNIGKKEDNVKYGNDAANNQTTVGSGQTINNNSADSIATPSNDPHAMQDANTKMSGLGESGHAPANNSGPAPTDPNNKARKDTAKYK